MLWLAQDLGPLDISVVRKDGIKEKLKEARMSIIAAARALEKEQGKLVSQH